MACVDNWLEWHVLRVGWSGVCGEWAGVACVESRLEWLVWRVRWSGMCGEWAGVACVVKGCILECHV